MKTIHTHTLDISDTTYVPSNRNVFIACRKSQLSLTSYLALKMLALGPCIMTLTENKGTAGNQSLFIKITCGAKLTLLKRTRVQFVCSRDSNNAIKYLWSALFVDRLIAVAMRKFK